MAVGGEGHIILSGNVFHALPHYPPVSQFQTYDDVLPEIHDAAGDYVPGYDVPFYNVPVVWNKNNNTETLLSDFVKYDSHSRPFFSTDPVGAPLG